MNSTISKRDVIEAFQQAVAYAMTHPEDRTGVSRDEHMLWYLTGWIGSIVGLASEEMPRILKKRNP